jgi:hypothetical protein
MKGFKLRFLLKNIQKHIHHMHQHMPGSLHRIPPFPIPVGIGNEMALNQMLGRDAPLSLLGRGGCVMVLYFHFHENAFRSFKEGAVFPER